MQCSWWQLSTSLLISLRAATESKRTGIKSDCMLTTLIWIYVSGTLLVMIFQPMREDMAQGKVFSSTLSREYRVVTNRYSRLLFTGGDRLCANLRVQEPSRIWRQTCSTSIFARRHRSAVVFMIYLSSPLSSENNFDLLRLQGSIWYLQYKPLQLFHYDGRALSYNPGLQYPHLHGPVHTPDNNRWDTPLA